MSAFDPEPLIEYAITEQDLTNVYHYLRAMQAHLWPGSWEDISLGGYYGTSALLHEVVELRILLSRDPYLLTRSPIEIKIFARLPYNEDAHIQGLEEEYGYLQKVIKVVFNQMVDIGALLRANSKRPGDWQDLFDTTLPFFEPKDEDIHEAELILARLRTLKRRAT